MRAKKIIGLVLIILGVASYLFGNYVATQVVDGKKKIAKTQKTVNKVRGITDLNPDTKVVGKIATQPIQKKIDEGRGDVKTYGTLAMLLHTVGIVLFAIGLLLLLMGFLSKKKQ